MSSFTLKRSGKYCQLWGGQNSALHKGVFFYCSWNIAWLKNCNTQKFPVKGLNDGLKHWTLRSWCYKWKQTCPSTWSPCDLEVHQLSTLHHQLHLVCKELLAHLGYSGKGGGGGGWGQLVELLAVRGLSSGWQGLGWGTPGQQVSLMVGGSDAQVWAGVPLNCELRQGLSSRYEASCLGLFCGAAPWLHNQGSFCMSRWWHLLAVLGQLLPQAPAFCLLGGHLGVETPALMGACPPWQGEVLAEHNKSEVLCLLYVYVLKCLEKRGTADIFLCLHHRSTKSLETSFGSSLRDSLHQEQSWVAGEMMKGHHPVWPPRKIQRMALLTWRSAKQWGHCSSKTFKSPPSQIGKGEWATTRWLGLPRSYRNITSKFTLPGNFSKVLLARELLLWLCASSDPQGSGTEPAVKTGMEWTAELDPLWEQWPDEGVHKERVGSCQVPAPVLVLSGKI